MPIQNICGGLECTKLCLVPHIIKHVKEEGYLLALLSLCIHTPGARYWSWVNRYEGDLVVADLNAPRYPHVNTKWKVSMNFWLWSDVWGSPYLETRHLYSTRHCHSDFWMAGNWEWYHKCGTRSAVVVPPSAGGAFWNSHFEMSYSSPAFRWNICAEYWAWKSSLEHGNRSPSSGKLRSPHLH